MILVFGKTGQVGRELQKLEGIFCLDRIKVDLVDTAACMEAIIHYKPSAVINAAAYTAVDKAEQQEEIEEETNDDFENLYKGQISKSGVAILPSKRTRRIPEIKKPSLADEALSELKADQPEIKEENLEKEEAPLELSEEAPSEEENKSE